MLPAKVYAVQMKIVKKDIILLLMIISMLLE